VWPDISETTIPPSLQKHQWTTPQNHHQPTCGITTEDLHKAEAFFASLENRDKNNVDTSFPTQNFHESHQ
jgi:hypothetical protein